jgi:hypothetical protein
MAKFFMWFLVVMNTFIWFGNWALTQSSDKSGSGMVLMLTVPFGVVFMLLTLVFIGFMF